MMPQLVVSEVSKSFAAIQANDQVSLHVDRGEIVGLIGPNGSGKTTLFNAIVGQHRIDGGRVFFEGKDISGLYTADIARSGLVRTFQRTRMYSSLTCLENMFASEPPGALRLSNLLLPVPGRIKLRAVELLDLVGLSECVATAAGELSFGQQRLLEIGMALMSEPKMLLLDEPASGISPAGIESLVDKLKLLNSSLDLTLLVIEHNIPVIMNLARRVYCLHRGSILAEGGANEIKANPKVIEAYLGGGA